MRIQLKRVFGIGYQRASYLCDLVGIMKGCDISMLTRYRFALIIGLIKRYYGIDLILKRSRFNRLKRFLSVKSYNSMRLKFGLPIRGQKTHNNARTAKTRKVNLSAL